MIEQISSTPVYAGCDNAFASAPFTRAAVSRLVETTLDQIALSGVMSISEVDLAGKLITQIIFHNAAAINALNRIEEHDPYTAMHSLNVCILALSAAYAEGIDESAAETLAVAALLHDIGKTRVPLRILNKPSPLVFHELEIMRRHAILGEDILRTMPEISAEALLIAAQHHERLDGSGYPRGLRGPQLHRLSQLMAVADVFDGLTSARAYRPALSPAAALVQIGQTRDAIFAGEVVDLFVACLGVSRAA